MKKNKNRFNNLKNYQWDKLILEIVVVFLGVTAGFLLNNWRQDTNKIEYEQKYLSGFLQDVDANIIDLKESIESDSIWIEYQTDFLKKIKVNRITLDSANIVVKNIINVSKSELHEGTYQDIISSGNLNLLSNFELKERIIDYHISIKGIKYVDEHFNEFYKNFIMPFIFTYYDIFNEKFESVKILKSNKFKNIIGGYFSFVQQRKKVYSRVLEKSILLREKLKSALE